MYALWEVTVIAMFVYSKTVRVWEVNPVSRKVTPTDCNLGQIKRIINCVQIADDDAFMYCGTTTGDVLQVQDMHVEIASGIMG